MEHYINRGVIGLLFGVVVLVALRLIGFDWTIALVSGTVTLVFHTFGLIGNILKAALCLIVIWALVHVITGNFGADDFLNVVNSTYEQVTASEEDL